MPLVLAAKNIRLTLFQSLKNHGQNPNPNDFCEELCSPMPKKEDGFETNRGQDIRCAEAALAYYNERHGTNYKLVEATSNGFLRICVWYHSYFLAVPADQPQPQPAVGDDDVTVGDAADNATAVADNNNNNNNNTSVTRFFAEIKHVDRDTLEVLSCCILKDGKTSVDNCLWCQSMGVPHPTDDDFSSKDGPAKLLKDALARQFSQASLHSKSPNYLPY